MAEPQKRNTERTRRAVLDAAMHAILDRGTGVTLAEIAESAGVSKSGLIHHFGSRDQLFVAVVQDMSEQLRAAVVAELDLSENHPGKMLRAYVRALCNGGAEAAVARDFASAANWNGLYAMPAIAALLEEHDTWWSEQLAADGLSAQRIQIVRRAAEGVVAAALQGGEDASSIATARRLLLELATEGSFRLPL